MDEDNKSYCTSKLKKQLQVIHEHLNKYYKESGLYTELRIDEDWLYIQCSCRGQFYKVALCPVMTAIRTDDETLTKELDDKIGIIADIYKLLKTRGD